MIFFSYHPYDISIRATHLEVVFWLNSGQPIKMRTEWTKDLQNTIFTQSPQCLASLLLFADSFNKVSNKSFLQSRFYTNFSLTFSKFWQIPQHFDKFDELSKSFKFDENVKFYQISINRCKF